VECPGSVHLSEGLPDKDSVWSKEGTRAHEVLEQVLGAAMKSGSGRFAGSIKLKDPVPPEMMSHAVSAANFLLTMWETTPGAELLVETRIHLDFIHPEMFGTFDGAVIEHFDTLHVFDYKYGAGHAVSPKRNLQMIFYGMGLAAKHNWNFKTVRLWIIQPRIKGYDGPTYWEIPMFELLEYVDFFKRAVERVVKKPKEFNEGSWCHWCKAKSICPLKRETKNIKAKALFGVFEGETDGKEEKEIGKEETFGQEKGRKEKTKGEEAQGYRRSGRGTADIRRAFGSNGSYRSGRNGR